jgi:hypothetical protein
LSKGIVNGYTENTQPDNELTKGKLPYIDKGIGDCPTENAPLDLTDWSKVPSWAAGYIYEAVKGRITTG